MTISDTGAAVIDVSAAANCDQVSVNEVECSPVDGASFFLDDMDDDAAVTGAGTRLTVDGWSGNDRLSLCADCGGTLMGGPGDDRLVAGGSLRSLLVGDTGDDTLIGRAGRDEIRGGAGADVISGRGGADRISPSSGNDVIGGGRGRDHVFLDTAPGKVTVDLRAGTVTGWGSGGVGSASRTSPAAPLPTRFAVITLGTRSSVWAAMT